MKKKIIFTMLSLMLLLVSGCSGGEDTLEKELENVKDKLSGAADATLEDDKKFILNIDNVDYTFPMSFEEFSNYGWTAHYETMEETGSRTMKPGDYGLLYDMGDPLNFKNNKEIQYATVFMLNPDKEKECLVKDAIVYGIEFETDYNVDKFSKEYAKDNVGLKLGNKEIILNKSSREEVQEFFGDLLLSKRGYLSPHLNMFFEYNNDEIWYSFSYVFEQKKILDWYKK